MTRGLDVGAKVVDNVDNKVRSITLGLTPAGRSAPLDIEIIRAHAAPWRPSQHGLQYVRSLKLVEEV